MARPQQPSIFGKLLNMKSVMAVSGAILVFIAAGIIDEVQRRKAVQAEISAIEDEVARLEAQRERLTSLIEHADSPEFLEREARLRLGLQRPGEKVFIVSDRGGLSQELIPGDEDDASEQSNIRRWWNYLFGGNAP
jgi:cell division protein FtsB